RGRRSGTGRPASERSGRSDRGGRGDVGWAECRRASVWASHGSRELSAVRQADLSGERHRVPDTVGTP
ncbi:hypothetical protein PYK79_19485, partial [Streptomyces sp. ID05-04B]|nr:hypothetical protein [Streptomyces sp. ID05-04B]